MEGVHGPLAENQTVQLNPLVFAGWVGIFITALNLLPIGQLDGGHILYTLIGKPAHLVAFGLIFATALTLVIVPSLNLVFLDVKKLAGFDDRPDPGVAEI